MGAWAPVVRRFYGPPVSPGERCFRARGSYVLRYRSGLRDGWLVWSLLERAEGCLKRLESLLVLHGPHQFVRRFPRLGPVLAPVSVLHSARHGVARSPRGRVTRNLPLNPSVATPTRRGLRLSLNSKAERHHKVGCPMSNLFEIDSVAGLFDGPAQTRNTDLVKAVEDGIGVNHSITTLSMCQRRPAVLILVRFRGWSHGMTARIERDVSGCRRYDARDSGWRSRWSDSGQMREWLSRDSSD